MVVLVYILRMSDFFSRKRDPARHQLSQVVKSYVHHDKCVYVYMDVICSSVVLGACIPK